MGAELGRSDCHVPRRINCCANLDFDTAINGWLVEEGHLSIATSPVIGLVAETGCTFFESVAFPDALEAGIRVQNLGRSSIRYEIGIFQAEAAEAAAQGHFVHVMVERASGRPVPIPDALRAALTSLCVP
jgi:acyl-CoA thioester hydrolase